jgi:hypothetical protein
MLRLKNALAGRPGYYAALALALVGLRVVCFDWAILGGKALPNHDMSQDLAFFCTNLHSVRLTGDLAWWNPTGWNGCAQYYQSFLSPLAPTTHHITFILWAQAVGALGRVGVALPEYYQYVAFNYLLLPLLASWAFVLFAGQLFRRRAAVALAGLAYTLSGIGVWNSAWFYFQEPFSLYLFLAACLGTLRRPTRRRLLLLTAAALVQLTSFNYWTMYNAFYIVIVLGAYGWAHPFQLRRLVRRTRQVLAARPWSAGALGLTAGASLLLWGVLLACVVREQAGSYIRSGTAGDQGFTTTDAYLESVKLVWYFLVLFKADLPWRITAGPEGMAGAMCVHQARYIGGVLLPLLVLLATRRWGRRERFLVAAGVAVVVVCLAPPFLLVVWRWTPMMDHIRHLFYYYSQHGETLVVLLAASSLDALRRAAHAAADRRRGTWAMAGLCVVMALMLLWHGKDVPAMAPVALIASGLLFQRLGRPAAAAGSLCTGTLLALLAADLGRYFWEVNTLDQKFTQTYVPSSLEEAGPALRRAWSEPDAAQGFKGALQSNMPLHNSFWPTNNYMSHRFFLPIMHNSLLINRLCGGEALHFTRSARLVASPDEAAKCLLADPAAHGDAILLQEWSEEDNAAGRPQPAGDAPADGTFAWECQEWAYNAFRFRVSAPDDGWLVIRQVNDPYWRVTVDGRPVRPARAEFMSMGLPVRGGVHQVAMQYRPPSRSLYWPACWLLEGALALLLGGAAFSRAAAARRAGERRATAPPLRAAA